MCVCVCVCINGTLVYLTLILLSVSILTRSFIMWRALPELFINFCHILIDHNLPPPCPPTQRVELFGSISSLSCVWCMPLLVRVTEVCENGQQRPTCSSEWGITHSAASVSLSCLTPSWLIASLTNIACNSSYASSLEGGSTLSQKIRNITWSNQKPEISYFSRHWRNRHRLRIVE